MGSQIFCQEDTLGIHDSPYSVIYNHLYYLQSDSYDPSQSARSLPASTETARTKAIQLKQILDGKGLFIDLNRLPSSPNHVDTLSREAIYLLDSREPLIYVERREDGWYYSRTTVDAIDGLHKKLYPFGTAFVTAFEAPAWQMNLLGIAIWKWLGLVVLLFLSGLVAYLIDKLSVGALRRLVNRRVNSSDEVNTSLFKITRLIGLIIGVRFLVYLLPMLQLAPRINALFIRGLAILSIFFVILLLRNVMRIVFVYLGLITSKTENTLDDQLLPVLHKLASIVIWSIGIIAILDYLDVNVTALLAGISIGGLALALAAQDTVKNLFGSIMIFLDKPFQIGDWISFGGVDGTVEEVGVRSTRIRTFANSITYVPNGKLADSVVDNMGLRVYRRFKTDIGITYDTPPDRIDQFVEGIREIIRRHPQTRKDYFEVHLNSFGASSINILLYMFFEVPSWTEELRSKHQVLHAIIMLAHRLDVRFAFPTQTVHIEELPQLGSSIPPESGPMSETVLTDTIRDIDAYFKAHQ
ncbi:MAG: mechanosensitive ion channel family protein [Bacteroidota bacterium]